MAWGASPHPCQGPRAQRQCCTRHLGHTELYWRGQDQTVQGQSSYWCLKTSKVFVDFVLQSLKFLKMYLGLEFFLDCCVIGHLYYASSCNGKGENIYKYKLICITE